MPPRPASREPPPEPAPSRLEALRAGERAAQAWLFDEHVAVVERMLFRVLGPDVELEDLIQDTFLQALTSISSFRGNEASLPAWLRSVAVRTALKRLRWRSVRRRFGLRMEQGWLDVPDAVEPGVHAALVRAHAALDTLASPERVAFVLRYVEDLELREVAEACGVSLATIKRRLQRARERMHRIAACDSILSNWLAEGER